MTVTPSGVISIPMQLARALLADCQAFRDLLTPSMDQAAALARIHYNGLPAPDGDEYTLADLTALRPFAIVSHNPNHGFRTEVNGVSGDTWDWEERGKLLVKIERTALEVVNKLPSYDSFLDFQNAIGGIIGNCYDLVGGEDYLGVTAISILLGPYGVGEDDSPGEGVWEAVELEFEYKGVSA